MLLLRQSGILANVGLELLAMASGVQISSQQKEASFYPTSRLITGASTSSFLPLTIPQMYRCLDFGCLLYFHRLLR